MQMLRFLLIVAGQLTIVTSFSQSRLSGSVTDDTGEPLAFARLTLTSTENGELVLRASSDFDGLYEFDSLAADEYHLRVQYLGLKVYEVKLAITNSMEHNITMLSVPTFLEEIDVYGVTMPLIDRDEESPSLTERMEAHFDSVVCLVDSIQEPGTISISEARARLFKKIQYPPKAEWLGIEGRVFVYILVGDQGEFETVRLERGISPCVDAAVLSTFLSLPEVKMPRTYPNSGFGAEGWFEPGEYVIPYKFQLE